MKPFAYARATDTDDALRLLTELTNAKLLGGGTNLVDLMREQIEQPDALVDVTGLPLGEIADLSDGGLRLGAAVRNTAVAQHRAVRERYPFLAQAILFGASGQIRNMATVGGNLMQRTRCPYFYDLTAACNKRAPSAGCDAINGFNRNHAILGASPQCVATFPSDLCMALAALDATVNVASPRGERVIPFTEFHRLPGDRPDIDTNLLPDELITSVDLPPLDVARHSVYRKVRDRASYAFALVSVAAALEVEDGAVRHVRLALGGVAHKPWRAFAAEAALRGAPATAEQFRRAADLEMAPAVCLSHNAFKIELAARTITAVLTDLAARGDNRPGGE